MNNPRFSFFSFALLTTALLLSPLESTLAQDVDLLLQQMEARENNLPKPNEAQSAEPKVLTEEAFLNAWPKTFPSLISQALGTDDWNSTQPVQLQLPESLTTALPEPAEIWSINTLLFVGTVYPDAQTMQLLSQQGVKTLVSFDVNPPDPLLARANGMSWVHVPSLGHDISLGNYLRVIRVFTFMEGNYYLHAGPGEYRAYPVAALATKWIENRYSRAPLRPLHTLYALGYPKKYLSGWQSALSPLALLQEQYKPLPANFATLNTERPLPPTMQQFQAWLDALQDTAEAEWEVPPHLAPRSPREDAANIAELATRWAALTQTDSPALSAAFQETATSAQELEQSLSQRKTPTGLNAALLKLENTCFACHQAYRDGVK